MAAMASISTRHSGRASPRTVSTLTAGGLAAPDRHRGRIRFGHVHALDQVDRELGDGGLVGSGIGEDGEDVPHGLLRTDSAPHTAGS